MKKLNYLLSAVVLLAVLVMIGCSKDDGPGITPEQAVTNRMAKTWVLTNVTFDTDATDLINPTALTLTITDALGYSTNSASVARTPNPWPVGGLWDFVGEITDAADANFTIRRDNLINMDVTLTDTSLTLTMDNYDIEKHKGSKGKDEGTDGNWVFVFAAQQ